MHSSHIILQIDILVQTQYCLIFNLKKDVICFGMNKIITRYAWANYLIEKNYSKIFDIHFAIWYPIGVETGQPLLKLNNVKYC